MKKIMWCLTRGTGGSLATSSGWTTLMGTASTCGCALGAPGARERVKIRKQLSGCVVGPRTGPGWLEEESSQTPYDQNRSLNMLSAC